MARVAGIRESSASLAARLGMKDWQVDRARRDLSQAPYGARVAMTVTRRSTAKTGSRDAPLTSASARAAA
jgi:DNA polymerase-3 subunit delta